VTVAYLRKKGSRAEYTKLRLPRWWEELLTKTKKREGKMIVASIAGRPIDTGGKEQPCPPHTYLSY